MLDEASDKLASELVGWIFGNLSTLLEAAGQVTDAHGNLTVDTVIETLSNMQLSFEPDGTWRQPTIYAGAGAAAKLAALPLPTPEQTYRVNEIVSRKRREFFAARGRRRISRVSF